MTPTETQTEHARKTEEAVADDGLPAAQDAEKIEVETRTGHPRKAKAAVADDGLPAAQEGEKIKVEAGKSRKRRARKPKKARKAVDGIRVPAAQEGDRIKVGPRKSGKRAKYNGMAGTVFRANPFRNRVILANKEKVWVNADVCEVVRRVTAMSSRRVPVVQAENRVATRGGASDPVVVIMCSMIAEGRISVTPEAVAEFGRHLAEAMPHVEPEVEEEGEEGSL